MYSVKSHSFSSLVRDKHDETKAIGPQPRPHRKTATSPAPSLGLGTLEVLLLPWPEASGSVKEGGDRHSHATSGDRLGLVLKGS